MKRESMATQISPKNVVGRDKLIDLIWKKLGKKSIRFTAERRVGKTTVMAKMEMEKRSGFEVVFLEVEGIDSPAKFTQHLFNKVNPLMSKSDKAIQAFYKLFNSLGGTEVAGLLTLPEHKEIDWQNTLYKTFELISSNNIDKVVVVMIDELPYMLQKIASLSSSENQKTLALTFLDSMRAIRQKHNNIRMIYAGSVGLHHVVSEIKQSTLASQPVNDMPIVDIRELDKEDAFALAKNILKEEEVEISESEYQKSLRTIIALADYIPFYIEAVCTKLGEIDSVVNPKLITELVNNQLFGDNDPWEMEHFRSRIEVYYPGVLKVSDNKPINKAVFVRALLDHLALNEKTESIDQIYQAMKSRFPIDDKQVVIQLLKSLAQDHYLTTNSELEYEFRFALIKDWWKKAQGLTT